ncbi:MAG TPA: hypothetical protein VFV84_15105 [Burkholderiales bacterium]|nr:hypothetical protein [Burkholderiales bacterium]
MSRVPVRVAADGSGAPAGWAVLKSGACPCCVGKIQLQVELVRLVREQRPPGVVIELADAGHARTLRRALREWPFSDHLVVLPE